MANPLKLPFDFAPNSTPTTQQLQANFNALLQFVSDLNTAVISLTNLVVGTLQTTSTATIGGALTAQSTLGVTGAVTASSTVAATGLVTANNGVTVNNAPLTANSTTALVGAATAASTLDVTGDVSALAKMKLSDSTLALTFSSSTNMGIEKVATNVFAAKTAGTQAWKVDASGNIIQPVQPSFLALRAAVTGNAQTGNSNPFNFPTESYDIGNNFASNVFTAPVAGKYFFSFSINIGPSGGSPAGFFKCDIVTSSQTYRFFQTAPAIDNSVTMAVVADMALGDTAKVAVTVLAAGTTWSSEVDAMSFFTGTLIN